MLKSRLTLRRIELKLGSNFPSSMNLEEHSDLKTKKSDLLENSDGEVDNMEVEDRTEPEVVETCLSSYNTSNSKIRTALFPAWSNTNQEPVTGCNTLKGAIRCSRPVEENEELRNFNPRLHADQISCRYSLTQKQRRLISGIK